MVPIGRASVSSPSVTVRPARTHRLTATGTTSIRTRVRAAAGQALAPLLLPKPRTWGPPPDWSNRTLARLKCFCSLNRAGNALCAWHNSRCERGTIRAVSDVRTRHEWPHTTPSTVGAHKEALFEKSLARNRVSAFHPGDHVCMDPTLRNPLLKLLEERSVIVIICHGMD